MKSSHLSRGYSLWVTGAGTVFALAMGAQLFFSRTDYGFLYNEALIWLCWGSFANLLVVLTVWLCRRVIKRRAAKALVSVACAVLSLFAFGAAWLTLFLSCMVGHTVTGAGSISGNRYDLHISPGGTDRLVIMFTGADEEQIYAYPMLNRWIYKEIDNGFVWEPHIQRGEYSVEWETECRAVVEILRYSGPAVDGENLDDRILVDFDGIS